MACFILKLTYPAEDWSTFCDLNSKDKARQKDNEKALDRLNKVGIPTDMLDPGSVDQEVDVGSYVKCKYNIYNDTDFLARFDSDMITAGVEKNAMVTNQEGEDEEVFACRDESKPRSLVSIAWVRTKLNESKMPFHLRAGQPEDAFDHTLGEILADCTFRREKMMKGLSGQQTRTKVAKRLAEIQKENEGEALEAGPARRSKKWFGRKGDMLGNNGKKRKGKGKGTPNAPSASSGGAKAGTPKKRTTKELAAASLGSFRGVVGISDGAATRSVHGGSVHSAARTLLTEGGGPSPQQPLATFNFAAIFTGSVDRNAVSGAGNLFVSGVL